MSEYLDQRIESIEPVVDYDDYGKTRLCADINLDFDGQYVTIFLTKAELRKVLEHLEAL